MKYFARINAIANRLERLASSQRDPFRFHEDKSELVHELRRLADESAGLRAANDNIKGFAHGHYMCICNECGKRFSGAKHSWRCEECEPQVLPQWK
ncbi:hypothetical protein A6U84_03315 [Agrobacterium sp. 13-2099-1-2]|uniref:hypothetical protein n=1 Tax=Agrobacterium sp. 13-2099-1-2 TaxID=1841651 RepID=UPI00080FC284|nr:hypothetical protein [Agrobacterium sp. 13-2099-1-2]UZX42353.1 hypothetical protein A6U84_03315 [Agrobacterium sp. 13-2099-1-2]